MQLAQLDFISRSRPAHARLQYTAILINLLLGLSFQRRCLEVPGFLVFVALSFHFSFHPQLATNDARPLQAPPHLRVASAGRIRSRGAEVACNAPCSTRSTQRAAPNFAR